jgi:hypothetical protein
MDSYKRHVSVGALHWQYVAAAPAAAGVEWCTMLHLCAADCHERLSVHGAPSHSLVACMVHAAGPCRGAATVVHSQHIQQLLYCRAQPLPESSSPSPPAPAWVLWRRVDGSVLARFVAIALCREDPHCAGQPATVGCRCCKTDVRASKRGVCVCTTSSRSGRDAGACVTRG